MEQLFIVCLLCARPEVTYLANSTPQKNADNPGGQAVNPDATAVLIPVLLASSWKVTVGPGQSLPLPLPRCCGVWESEEWKGW